ncbi:hypothetical protein N0O92_05240 [Alkalihalobacillus sp. MEB130]|uniref:hypothetical protein n=1 Tax=Alkalihalobacillus sp. MEB130 TaxID=2976704 RepID=UPI0028DFDF44|nr:hypothetical protein [Alkalihalobacillus sp. MEB130]MDT8859631.1 hypothetical protein [Alkalihalobacillus sp. MEB130]
MTRLSRTSRIKAERVQASFVNRMTEVNSIDQVQPIERTGQTKNHTSHPSENHLFGYERYYQTRQEIKRTFKQFYRQEKELSKAASQLDETSNQILTQIQNLVQKYNVAVHALADFDAASGTNHLSSIHDLIRRHPDVFSSIAMNVDERQMLSFDPPQFLILLAKSKETTLNYVKQFKTLLLDEYRLLARSKKTTFLNQYEASSFNLKGLIIEEEG